MHRLKQIREQLKLSQEEFGRVVEEAINHEEKWPFQKVSRLERGETDLSVSMILQICRAFPSVEPWHLLVDPDLIYPPPHKRIISAYMLLSEGIREAVDKLLFAGEKIDAPLIYDQGVPEYHSLNDKIDILGYRHGQQPKGK